MAGTSNKVFVGGLPQGLDDATFQEYFQKFGNITDVVVMKDNATGNTRGFGFVTFDDASAVDQVMDMYKDHQINGKWVEVKRATPKGAEKGGGGGGGKGGGKDKGGKPGDWSCPQCNNNVWGSKDVCGRCQTPRPQQGDAGGCGGCAGGYSAPPAYGGAPAYGAPAGVYGAPPAAYGAPPAGAYGGMGAYAAYGAYGMPPAYGGAPPAYGGQYLIPGGAYAAPPAYGAYGAAPSYPPQQQYGGGGKGAAPY